MVNVRIHVHFYEIWNDEVWAVDRSPPLPPVHMYFMNTKTKIQ